MVKIIDLGCDQHQLRELTVISAAAELLSDLCFNLPREGEFHTFICEHGQTHYLRVIEVSCLKLYAQGLEGPTAVTISPTSVSADDCPPANEIFPHCN